MPPEALRKMCRKRGEFAMNIRDEEFRFFGKMRGRGKARYFGGCLFTRGIERMEGLELLLVLCVHISPVHRRDNARLFTARLAIPLAMIQRLVSNNSTALLISKKLPYYISKYTVGEFRKIFHLAYFLATVRLDLLIGEIKKMKESTSCVQRMPKNVTLRASSLLVV